MNTSDVQNRQLLASEVLELGESLFETALEAGSHQAVEGEESEAYPIEEVQAATNEFFTALRLLLDIEPIEGR